MPSIGKSTEWSWSKKTITSNINFTADTATAKSAMSSLTNALADYKENGLEKMDIFKLQVLNDEDTFGNTNMLAYSVG